MTKLIRKAGYNTQLIVVPAHMVTDSQYPFREAESIVLEMKDNRTLEMRLVETSEDEQELEPRLQ